MDIKPVPRESTDFLHQVANIAETIGNLNYVMHVYAEDPAAVRLYSDAVTERIQSLQLLLRAASLSGNNVGLQTDL